MLRARYRLLNRVGLNTLETVTTANLGCIITHLIIRDGQCNGNTLEVHTPNNFKVVLLWENKWSPFSGTHSEYC
jgi:hypothetical protein